jgi:hypothetical protein
MLLFIIIYSFEARAWAGMHHTKFGAVVKLYKREWASHLDRVGVYYVEPCHSFLVA